MEVRRSLLPGCVEIRPTMYRDERGTFAKPFHLSTFAALGLETVWKEHFYSVSSCGVVRGLHLQTPPAAQAKLVCCLVGAANDVVVDVRVGSPTYGKSASFRLTGDQMTAVFVPIGMAHGFAALADGTVIAYAVSAEHDPEHDTGIRWDSVPDIEWPREPQPVVSVRDRALPLLSDFVSPFTFDDSGG